MTTKREVCEGLGESDWTALEKYGKNTYRVVYRTGWAIRLHHTNVFYVSNRKIWLDSGDWRSLTTKGRINDGFAYLNMSIGVWAKKGVWYVHGLKNFSKPVKFYDGMCIDLQGNLLNENILREAS